MSAPNESVLINGAFSEPLTAQHNFTHTYNMEDPLQAMSSYARDMHRHTKKQMETANLQSERHQSPPDFPPALTAEPSCDSVDSRDLH
ncbi:MAG: hypothetical protein M4579_003053 [Chaenotheca gracillima]|nr:MAG: hypothetical protein M4579_003053 [Chaenotheca gracillima]